MGTGIPRFPGFNSLFVDGLHYHLPAFPQAYCLLVLSWACLPTQLMAPDSMNVALHALPKLHPSPRDYLL